MQTLWKTYSGAASNRPTEAEKRNEDLDFWPATKHDVRIMKWESSLEFVKAAVKNPRQVSTVFQTTPFTVALMLRGLGKIENPFVVELGVGAGAVTFFLRRRLRDPKNYIGFELNESLARFAQAGFPDLKIINDSAENLQNHVNPGQADLVVSTLPWTLLPPEVATRILEQARRCLKPGGRLVTYMVAPNVWTEPSQKMQGRLREIFPHVEEEWSMLNAPPAKVFRATV